MKLKLSLKNSARPGLLLNLILIIFLSGCTFEIEPTYKEKDIPDIVTRICKQEYNLDVNIQRVKNTLWIYSPLSKILHDDYGIDEEKIFDEEMMEKLRNILTTVGRVLISADNAPEFYAILVSDINKGIDYIMVGNLTDIKKSYAGAIPWPEANRRYVVGLAQSPEAIQDMTGEHFAAYDINFGDFLAAQIAQRISAEFQSERLKDLFLVESCEGYFLDNAFLFEYSIKQIVESKEEIDTQDEMLKIIAYCVNTYEFADFDEVKLTDSSTQKTTSYNRTAILSYPTD